MIEFDCIERIGWLDLITHRLGLSGLITYRLGKMNISKCYYINKITSEIPIIEKSQ